MSRPRGFIESWRPQAKTAARLDAVLKVLHEYEAYLPLTIRQIFYRLVAAGIIGKTERDYGNLCELLGKARRCRIIPMDVIRDDGFRGGRSLLAGWPTKTGFIHDLHDRAARYRKDRQAGQMVRLILWCEASGMVPQLEQVAHEYGVLVKSSGGFDSLTTKHEFGSIADGVHVLHIGDYDPSGECMFDALAEDMQAFADYYGNSIEFSRLAVTPAQIREYDLPTAPPKASSHQVKKQMFETVQAEALDPATLAGIVRDAIESRMDLAMLESVMEIERIERDALAAMTQQFINQM